MPELSRFFGIVIRMFSEAGATHHLAHFHACFQDEAAVFSIRPVDLIAARSRKNSGDLSKHGPSCIRTNYWPIGISFIPAKPLLQLSR